MSEATERASARRALRRQWGVVLVLATALTAGGSIALAADRSPRHGVRWASAATAVVLFELWLLWRYLDRNRDSETGALVGSLGLGTGATIARGLAIAAVAGFVVVPLPRPGTGLSWVPAGLYASAVALDWLDGRLARRRDHVTALGSKLDCEFDWLGVLVAGLLAVRAGVFPVWFLAAGLARPLYLVGIWLHRRRGGTVGPLPVDPWRRRIAGIQMLVCVVALAPGVDATTGTILATVAIPSLLTFVRDFVVVVRGE